LTFAHPLRLLAALAPITFLCLAYVLAERRRTVQALRYSNLAFMLAAMKPSRLPALALFGMWFLSLSLLACAVAGPLVPMRVPVKDGTVILCIDTSGSMRARDLIPSRAQAAKAAARNFIDDVPAGARIGIVTFATSALLVQPPTSDLEVARDALERIPAPNGATAIGDALLLANEQMPAHGHRVVILLTDGVNNRGGDPIQAAQALGARGVSAYTVGVGAAASNEIVPGTNELADLNEDALRAIAQNANGSYVQARDASSLRGAFRDLARATVWEMHRVDVSLGFALGGAALLVAGFLTGVGIGKFP
jgi:Ca-activated chloride channel family protein